MRAALITRQGTPVAPNLALVHDHPEPAAGPGEVLVRTEAAALNHLDLWVGRGVPGARTTYPHVPGCDACGRVEAVGAGVDASWIDRRVILNAAVPHPRPSLPGVLPVPHEVRVIGEHSAGCLTDRFVAPAANVLAVGDEADAVEAAAFGLAHVTAWRMLVSRAGLRPGGWVLITGIGGGVALAALGIARHLGARTIVTSRHAGKLEKAAALGAEHGILDTGADWSSEVRAITGKRGVDVCVDSIGRATHGSCVRSLARGGVFVTCGCTTGPDATTDLARLFWLELRLIGSTMGDMDEFRQVTAVYQAGGLHPVIDSTYTVEDVASAFERLESGSQFGKVVVTFS